MVGAGFISRKFSVSAHSLCQLFRDYTSMLRVHVKYHDYGKVYAYCFVVLFGVYFTSLNCIIKLLSESVEFG